jgi:hypothetical protein
MPASVNSLLFYVPCAREFGGERCSIVTKLVSPNAALKGGRDSIISIQGA